MFHCTAGGGSGGYRPQINYSCPNRVNNDNSLRYIERTVGTSYDVCVIGEADPGGQTAIQRVAEEACQRNIELQAVYNCICTYVRGSLSQGATLRCIQQNPGSPE